MVKALTLSELVNEIEETISERFEGEACWLTCEITDVKKQPDKRWCYLKFIEKQGNSIISEIRGVFWANSYSSIEKFEKLTGQTFANGLEITCLVSVRFHKRYGMSLEVLEIDHAFALGKLELEKQQTLERLLKENPEHIRLIDGQYFTKNKELELPIVLQRIALVTAPNSDGQRDFRHETENNQYGYSFLITEFLTQVQGNGAADMILQQLNLVEKNKENFDVVAIVRGGGSQTDFKPFDDYELSKYVATFPLPVFTGIGHDRNTSIVDMMARQHKTPTKVAASIVDHNFNFESEIMELKQRFFNVVESLLEQTKTNLENIKRTVKAYSPATILKKGYAIITLNDKIIINPSEIEQEMEIKTMLRDTTIYSTVTKKTKNETDI